MFVKIFLVSNNNIVKKRGEESPMYNKCISKKNKKCQKVTKERNVEYKKINNKNKPSTSDG